ncbi:hypothetical protein WHR41_09040 [Cladosporium halotolerans]|uniref:Rhodopsin domain-containing protein n=1 Tax=Cladosporium halotolerans TaxID=1052096 RepID=A0AB34KB53_9PEZI
MSAPAPTPQEQMAQAAAAAAAAKQFNIEAFTLLGIGITIIALRTYARVSAVGLRRLQADDYLVWFAAVCYAVETALAYSVGNAAHGLANNGMTPAERAALSPESPEFALRILGSKIQLAGWTTYGTLLWTLKGSLLVFYTRLTAGLGRNYEIRIYVGYVVVTVSYMVIILNLFLGCHPFHRNWQINPDPGNVCQPAISGQVVWVFLAFNVITDVYLLSIPLPMLWKATIRPLKKAGLMFLFGGGTFVIACAILRCALIVTDPVHGAQLAGSWAVRETFVAVVTTNLPMVYPLFHALVAPYVSTLVSTMRSTQKQSSTPHGIITVGGGGGGSGLKNARVRVSSNPLTNVTFSESEERMVGNMEMNDIKPWSEASSNHTEKHALGQTIQKEVEVAVVCQNGVGQDTLMDQQRQQALASIDDGANKDQGHFAFAEGPARKDHGSGV